MIEFKAECGHTVRAKDEDAGGLVRCSYCGRDAGVPDAHDSDLSFLFRDIETPAEESQAGGLFGALRRKPGRRRDFNPFAIIFRLCYIAAVIVVIIVVARKVVIPLFDEETRKDRFAGKNVAPTRAEEARENNGGGRGRYGLVTAKTPRGLLVASVPPGAQVFCIEASNAPETGGLRQLARCTQFRANGEPSRMAEGTYVVEVAFPWNDPRLSDPGLAHYDKYVAFRRAIESASEERRRELANSFFLPDGATGVFVDETVDQIYIVRQYRDVHVPKDDVAPVRALFLPRLTAGGSDAFLLEPLLHGYTPTRKEYRFDEQHVRSELTFYGVPSLDQPFVVDFLARVGVAPYMTPDRNVRFFKIDPRNGNITAQLLHATSP